MFSMQLTHLIDLLLHPLPADLNKVDEASLHRAKQLMSNTFTASLLRPGDPGYIYDKEVEFESTEESGWD